MEISDKRILLDPWLVGSLVFGNLEWLFKGVKSKTYDVGQQIDSIDCWMSLLLPQKGLGMQDIKSNDAPDSVRQDNNACNCNQGIDADDARQ